MPASKIKPDSKRIYVAGPYTRPDPCWNTARATVVGDFLCDRGYAPFVPHLSHHWHTAMPRPYQDWLALDLAWLGASHVMLRIPGESSGADEEEAFANSNGIPVHHSLRTLKIALCDDGPFDWPEWDDFFAGCRMTAHRIGMHPK